MKQIRPVFDVPFKAALSLLIVLCFSLFNRSALADEPVRELRVMTYNIHICIGMDKKLDVDRIARVIMKEKPDLVALQEVDRKTARVQRMDQVEELKKRTNMNVVFGKTIDHTGGEYGIALMSRFPINSQRTISLPNMNNQEPRVVLEAMVQVDEKTELRFLSTHFCHLLEERRIKQAETVNEHFATDTRLTIMGGDFNAKPDSKSVSLLREKWTDTTNGEPTFESGIKIDYIFFRPAGAFRVKETRVIREKVASDHMPVLSVLERIEL